MLLSHDLINTVEIIEAEVTRFCTDGEGTERTTIGHVEREHVPTFTRENSRSRAMRLVPKKVVLQIHLRSRALIINFLLLSTQVPPLDLICHEMQLSGDLAFAVYLAKARPVCYKSRPDLRDLPEN